MLKNYPNKVDAAELLSGFTNGFHIKYKGPRISLISKNLKSADEQKIVTQDKLKREVELRRMAGPFIHKPISTLRTSPIGVVPKKDGGWRLITHLSYPHGNSVNDYIDPEDCTVHYASFDQVIEMVSSLGKGALLGVHDIKSAFRLLPVHRSDFDLLGICFDDKFYVDKCLPFGCSVSCSLFEKFSSFIEWSVIEKSGKKSISHYLDDFFFAGKKDSNDCLDLMNSFTGVCSDLGVPIAVEKSVGPVTVLKFLGLEIDTIDMVVRIPQDKLFKLRSLLEPLLFRERIKFKEFESIIGLMAFCSRAITSSRAFLRRFYDILASVKVKKPFYSIRIGSELREDVRVWLKFLRDFNGDCYLTEKEWVNNDTLQLFTDGAGNSLLGCGAFFNGKWVQFQWPGEWENQPIMKDITLLELIPIVLAMFVWGFEFKNQKILFRIDNLALVNIINSRTSKSKRIMSLVRPLVLFTMMYNIQFKAKHIDGAKNQIADAISRFQMNRFRELVPDAKHASEAIPPEFLGTILKLNTSD